MAIADNVNIFGDYQHKDLPTKPVTSVDPNKLLAAMVAFATYVTAFAAEAVALLSESNATAKESFGEPSGGRFQRLGQFGAMEGRKVSGQWDVGYPISAYGDRLIYTQTYLDEANLADLNAHVVNNSIIYANEKIRMVNEAFLSKDNFTFDDNEWPGQKLGQLKCKRLCNGDAADEGYVYVNGEEIALKDLNHYLISGNASLNSAAFTLVRDALRNVNPNGKIVYLVSAATADAAEGLTGFVKTADPMIVDPQAKYAIVGSPRARGVYQGGEVWEWPLFPDNYVFGFDPTKRKPVKVRQHHLGKYQGLQLVLDDRAGEIVTNPLVNKRWRFIEGASVGNRVNGVVCQVKASGTYDNPVL